MCMCVYAPIIDQLKLLVFLLYIFFILNNLNEKKIDVTDFDVLVHHKRSTLNTI